MRLTGSQRGFSLIELLVAVFVIVLLTGVVSLNVGRGGAELELESEVRHLAGLLAFSSAEAGLSAADHGLFIAQESDVEAPGYEGIWLRRFDQGWAAPRGSPPSGERRSETSFVRPSLTPYRSAPVQHSV